MSYNFIPVTSIVMSAVLSIVVMSIVSSICVDHVNSTLCKFVLFNKTFREVAQLLTGGECHRCFV